MAAAALLRTSIGPGLGCSLHTVRAPLVFPETSLVHTYRFRASFAPMRKVLSNLDSTCKVMESVARRIGW